MLIQILFHRHYFIRYQLSTGINQSIGSIINNQLMSQLVKYLREDLIGSSLEKINTWMPDLSDHRLEANTFNKLAVIVGFFTTIGLTFKALKGLKSLAAGLHSFDKASIKNIYGEGSWALIGDVESGLSEAEFLATKGVNIILLGEAKAIEEAKIKLSNINDQIEVEGFPVNWEKQETDLGLYDSLLAKFQYYDISILIAPKVPKYNFNTFGADSKYPLVQHIFLLVNTFLKKLRWRAHRSAIVIFSDSRNQKIEAGSALQNGAVSAVDAFGRFLAFETKDFCDVVVVRKANTHQIFDGLGYKKIIDHSRQII